MSRCQPCSRGAQVPACLTVTHMVLSLLSSDPQPTPSLGADMTPHPLGFGTHTVAYPLWGELKDNVESSCGRPQDIVKLGSDGEGLWSNWRRNTDTRTCCPQAGGLAGKHVPDTLSTFSPMSRFCPPPSPSPAPESNLVMPSQRVRLLGCSARRGRAENGPGREGKWRHPPFPLPFHSPAGHTPRSLATAHSCKPRRAQKRLSEGQAEVPAVGKRAERWVPSPVVQRLPQSRVLCTALCPHRKSPRAQEAKGGSPRAAAWASEEGVITTGSAPQV